MQPLFPLGDVFATPAVLAIGTDLDALIHRHHCGDWGNLEECDRRANEEALASGERILSCYRVADRRRIYIITERDRSRTTLMLPEEY